MQFQGDFCEAEIVLELSCKHCCARESTVVLGQGLPMSLLQSWAGADCSWQSTDVTKSTSLGYYLVWG